MNIQEKKTWRTADFWYDLPENLIAQTPLEPRDSSRLMVLGREDKSIRHRHFSDLPDYLEEGDVLVLNNSKVLPARLYGSRTDTGSFIEFLLLEHRENDVWEILVRPGKRARKGHTFEFGGGLLRAEIIDVLDSGNRLARFTQEGNFYDVLERVGQMPLPHYITEELKDKNRYQTVYAEEPGSSAAPTAGLHFTDALLDRLREKGVQVVTVTLHVGLGTFRPVKAEEIRDHAMHSEHYSVSQETADIVNRAKKAGKRVIAVGTTSCRTLESVARSDGFMEAAEGYTDIFIYPGYTFKVLDGMITNFHLPESTLIMLVSAFAGYERTINAYKTAVEERYRFYSFGDSMMIL